MSANTEPAAGHAPRVTVDLDAIAANWRMLGARHGAPTAAVVKADGYGLGAVPIATRLYAEGCRHFFVAHLNEALALRPAIPSGLLGVLNAVPPESADVCLDHHIAPALGTLAEID